MLAAVPTQTPPNHDPSGLGISPDLATLLIRTGSEVQPLLVMHCLSDNGNNPNFQEALTAVEALIGKLSSDPTTTDLARTIKEDPSAALANPRQLVKIALSFGLPETESEATLARLYGGIYQTLINYSSNQVDSDKKKSRDQVLFVQAPGVFDKNSTELEGIILKSDTSQAAFVLAPARGGYFIIKDPGIYKALQNFDLIQTCQSTSQDLPDLIQFNKFKDKHAAWKATPYSSPNGEFSHPEKIKKLFQIPSAKGQIYDATGLVPDGCNRLLETFYAEPLNPEATQFRIFAINAEGRLLVFDCGKEDKSLKILAGAMRPCFFPEHLEGLQILAGYHNVPPLREGQKPFRTLNSKLEPAEFEQLRLGRTDLTTPDASSLKRRTDSSIQGRGKLFDELESSHSATFIDYESLLSGIALPLKSGLIERIRTNPRLPLMISEMADDKAITLVFGPDRLAIIPGLQDKVLINNFRSLPVDGGGQMWNAMKYCATLALASMQKISHQEFLERSLLNAPQELAFNKSSIILLADSSVENDLENFTNGKRLQELDGTYHVYEAENLLVYVSKGKLVVLSDHEKTAALEYLQKHFREVDYSLIEREKRLIESALTLKLHLSGLRTSKQQQEKFCDSISKLAAGLGKNEAVAFCGKVPYEKLIADFEPEARAHFEFLKNHRIYCNSGILVLESRDIVIFREQHAEVWGQISNTRTSQFFQQLNKNLATCQPTQITDNLSGFSLYLAYRAIEIARNISLADEVKKDSKDLLLADIKKLKTFKFSYAELYQKFPQHQEAIRRLSALGDASTSFNARTYAGLLICTKDEVLLVPEYDRIIANRAFDFFPEKPLLDAFRVSGEIELLKAFGTTLAYQSESDLRNSATAPAPTKSLDSRLLIPSVDDPLQNTPVLGSIIKLFQAPQRRKLMTKR